MTIDPSLADPTPEPAQAPRSPLTLEQAAWVLSVSPRTVRRLIATRKLRKLPLAQALARQAARSLFAADEAARRPAPQAMCDE